MASMAERVVAGEDLSNRIDREVWHSYRDADVFTEIYSDGSRVRVVCQDGEVSRRVVSR